MSANGTSTMSQALAVLGKSVSLFTLLFAVFIPASVIGGLALFPPPSGGGDFGGAGFFAVILMVYSFYAGGLFAAVSFVTATLAFPKFRWAGCLILFIAAVSFAIWSYMH